MFMMQSLSKACIFIRMRHLKITESILRHAYRNKSHAPEYIFPELKVQIRTCGNVYRKWKEKNHYRKLPDGDLTFQVPFIDTQPNDSRNSPTVLALHGAPGSWRDYVPLASFLHDRGCRFIAPSFPDFSTYKPGVFRHSDEEKAQYIKDFLDAISVKHLDLLACHSSAVYPGLQLCLGDAPSIKSLALLNPGTFDVKGMSSTKYFEFIKFFTRISEYPAALALMNIFGPFMLKKIFKVQVRFESILDPLLSATVMARSNIPESKEKFIAVSQKMPILFVFGEDDSLISKEPSYKLAEALGAKKSDVFIYDEKLCLEQEGTVTPQLKVIAVRQGSHYTFLKHSDFINSEIFNFMKNQKQISTSHKLNQLVHGLMDLIQLAGPFRGSVTTKDIGKAFHDSTSYQSEKFKWKIKLRKKQTRFIVGGCN